MPSSVKSAKPQPIANGTQQQQPQQQEQQSDAPSAAGPAWRQFTFYDATPIRDSQDFSKPPAALRAVNEVAAITSCPVRPAASIARTAAPPGGTIAAGAAASGSVHHPSVLVGEISGQVVVLEPERYSELARWSAYPAPGVAGSGRVTHITADARGRVITLGEEDGVRFPILRVWDLRVAAKSAQGAWSPRLLTEGKVQHGNRPHPIAAVAHTPSLSYFSVGLADGTVLLIRGLDSALMSAAASNTSASSASIPAVALPKFKVLFDSNSSADDGSHEPITALGFSESAPPVFRGPTKKDHAHAALESTASFARNDGPTPRRPRVARAEPPAADKEARIGGPTTVHLFIVTLSRILRYTVLGPGAGSTPVVVDDVGCPLGCAAVVPSSSPDAYNLGPKSSKETGAGAAAGAMAGKIVVARDEAIYVIGTEGREACFAYEGPKTSIRLSSSHLVIVSPPLTATASSASATVRHFVADRDRVAELSSSASRSSPQQSNARRGLVGAAPPIEIAKVSVFDLDNKLVAYSGAFEHGVRDAWVGPSGEICVLGDDGAVIRLDEKALTQQLSLLFRRSLFQLAVNLARSHAARAGTPEAAARVESLLGDIHRRYADHLYVKGDFEGAMSQFVKTIGWTQPSYVIRKFLDAQRINNLTVYLHELHAKGLANSDHTTLLLNCYTKLKDVASLDRFIKRPLVPSVDDVDESGDEREKHDMDGDSDGVHARDDLRFDLETAIRVCRQAGYYSHAAYLARRYAEHDEYLRIQIEDAQDFPDALAYIRSIEVDDAELYLQRYGKRLLGELPEDTTNLFIELCSGVFRPVVAGAGEGTVAAKPSQSAAAAFLASLQVGSYGRARSAQPSTTKEDVQQRPGSTSAEPAAMDRRSSVQDQRSKQSDNVEQPITLAANAPSPTIFFAHFIGHQRQLVRFLETVALARWGQSVDLLRDASGGVRDVRGARKVLSPQQSTEEDEAERVLKELRGGETFTADSDKRDQVATWNTLLELYLRFSRVLPLAPPAPTSIDELSISTVAPLTKDDYRQRALRLLEQKDDLPYDSTHALVLCSTEGFTDGIVLLYEQMQMHEDVVRLWMDAASEELAREGGSRASYHGGKNTACAKMLAALRKYGPEHPHLYLLVLRFLVSSETLLTQHRQDLTNLLDYIEDAALLSPLEIVQALSHTGVATVGLVRSYLTRAISDEQADIEADRRLVESYRLETAKKEAELAALTDPDTPRVFQVTKCVACGGQLDLPSVHFMCKHSYHQRCLGENETECPSCARSHGIIREIRRNNEQLLDQHELFLAEVQGGDGDFATIASFFSKGIFTSRGSL